MTPSEARELLPEEFSEVSDETINDLIDLTRNVCKSILVQHFIYDSGTEGDSD